MACVVCGGGGWVRTVWGGIDACPRCAERAELLWLQAAAVVERVRAGYAKPTGFADATRDVAVPRAAPAPLHEAQLRAQRRPPALAGTNIPLITRRFLRAQAAASRRSS